MYAIHLLCKNDENLTVQKMPIYESGYWDISLNEAQKLSGSRLYLHEKKGDKSYFGGRIIDFKTVDMKEYSHSKRIVFIFEVLEDGRGALWKGKSHDRAVYSIVKDGLD